MSHEIPEEPARRGSHTSASLCLDGPTEIYGCIIPRTKSARARNARKSWQHFEHLRTAMARTGRYEEEALHKAGVGANRPRVHVLHSRTPTHSPPDVTIGRSTPRSLYTMLHLCMSLFCLLRVLSILCVARWRSARGMIEWMCTQERLEPGSRHHIWRGGTLPPGYSWQQS